MKSNLIYKIRRTMFIYIPFILAMDSMFIYGIMHATTLNV